MEEREKTYLIKVEGVVQGVGFRPFIYHLANFYNLKGFVKNTKNGVELEITGALENIKNFLESIKKESPPLSIIKEIKALQIDYKDFKNFQIIQSDSGIESNVFISPDISICDECERDFYHKESRFFRYPFVNCTNCGPRFSIILDYPYDRKNTTMKVFSMCEECEGDYKNITSRRYHAQPVSCSKCGPHFKILDKDLREIEIDDPFSYVSKLIEEGNIIAVKGIGGYHLVLDGTRGETIKRLRERKKRDRKPFALLFRDIEIVSKYAEINSYEEEVLKSKERPIVLLKKKKNIINENPDPISGNSPYYGVMLPYAPFHYLLLQKTPILICTSANISGEPIVYREEELKRLSSIADYFLVHNREIVRFVEDSVAKVFVAPFFENNHSTFLFRKSRGYAPSPLFLKRSFSKNILSFGGDLKATISILKKDSLIQSQYLGDLMDYQSYESYIKTYEDFKKIFQFEPDGYICDLHPAYLSTRFAEEISSGKKLLKVQHHKAHIASVCLENDIYEEPVIGIALDGTGYGEDGMIWGGEVFLGSLEDGFRRAGHLGYMPFPFGDIAVKEPQRSYLSYLFSVDISDERFYEVFDDNIKKHIEILKKAVKESKTLTSSLGRLFDCVSYLLGFRRRVSYEGEAAIELENLIHKRFSVKDDLGIYNFNIEEGEVFIIDTKEIIKNVFTDWVRGVEGDIISIKFHLTIVSAFIEVAKLLSKKYGISRVALSGGAFQNSYLLYNFVKRIKESNLNPLINRYSPPNDACISIGQCALGIFQK